MIGRALVRLPVRSRLIRSGYQWQHDITSNTPAVLALRTYATPGRPKSVVGEPSRPVKRAVKKAAAKPSDGSSPAEKKVAANKRNATKKTSVKKTKEPTPEQRERTKQREAKRLERLEKEKAVKLARGEKAKARAEKERLVQLKKAALKEPKVSNANAYNVFLAEKVKAIGVGGGSRAEIKENLGRTVKEVSAQWKNLAAADVEHYNHLANSKKQDEQAEYKRWVESHSAEDIHNANLARLQLRRKFEHDKTRRTRTKWPAINDERAVKRPLTAFLQFSINRQASGDFKNIPFGERSKLISKEWKELNTDEKKKYDNLQKQESERYVSEYKDVYGHAPSFSSNGHDQPQAAAAAA